jgi:coenzyme Q-binding protein COQ10
MPSASRDVIVNVPPDHFFSVVTDYESYPEFIPETVDCKILEKKKKGKGRVCDVQFSIKVIKKIDYTLRLTEEPNDRITWELVDGPFKSNNGSWEIEASGKGKTKAVYTVDITMGFLVPQSITNMLVGSSLPKMLEQMKNRAEELWDAQGGSKKKKG